MDGRLQLRKKKKNERFKKMYEAERNSTGGKRNNDLHNEVNGY